jgi:hypothetical protein
LLLLVPVAVVVVVTGAPGAKRFPPVGLRFFSVGVTECDDFGPAGGSLLHAASAPIAANARTPTPTPNHLPNKMNHPLSSYLIGWQRSATSPIGQLQDRGDEPASFDRMRTNMHPSASALDPKVDCEYSVAQCAPSPKYPGLALSFDELDSHPGTWNVASRPPIPAGGAADPPGET